MAKYHIRKDGTPGVCHAQEGNCPLGGSENHVEAETLEQAQRQFDNKNEKLVKQVDREPVKDYDTTTLAGKIRSMTEEEQARVITEEIANIQVGINNRGPRVLGLDKTGPGEYSMKYEYNVGTNAYEARVRLSKDENGQWYSNSTGYKKLYSELVEDKNFDKSLFKMARSASLGSVYRSADKRLMADNIPDFKKTYSDAITEDQQAEAILMSMVKMTEDHPDLEIYDIQRDIKGKYRMWYKSKFRDNDEEEAYIDLDKTGDGKWYSDSMAYAMISQSLANESSDDFDLDGFELVL